MGYTVNQSANLYVLCGTAAFLGFFHTIISPDHYISFIALSKSNKWTTNRTMLFALLCGAAHIISSTVVGGVGILIGATINNWEAVDKIRGDISFWLLIVIGMFIMILGIKDVIKNRPHIHKLPGGETLTHMHDDEEHSGGKLKNTATAFSLFLVFLLGPCEVLIPLVMYPAATLGIPSALMVGAVFIFFTLATMLSVTFIILKGLSKINTSPVEKYSQLIAGIAIVLTGIIVRGLGI